LGSLGIRVPLRPVPVEVEVAIPFSEDRQHASYDAEAVGRWWKLLVEADRVLKRFRGRFFGKAEPGPLLLGQPRFGGDAVQRPPRAAPPRARA
jgi:hypothetical protein